MGFFGRKKELEQENTSKSYRIKKKKKQIRNRKIGFAMILVQIIAELVFIALLLKINILPAKYMIMLSIVLILITAYNITSQLTTAHMIGKALAFLLSAALVTGSVYVYKTNGMLDMITGDDTKYEYCSVIVLNSDPATSLADTKNYGYGYNKFTDNINSEKSVEKINQKLGTGIKTSSFDDWGTLVDALYSQSVKTIIVNESYRSVITENIEGFNDKTKVIDTIKIESVQKDSKKNIVEDPFSIYIAGNDESSKLDTFGRNDVNIIATFNPVTRQALLVTTPRDYWIDIYSLSENGIKKDKLTHAGNFGIDSSMTTLENLYATNLDYYVLVNFTGTVGIVDALGGIDIYSELKFTTTNDTAPIHYTFEAGENADCDGAKTLAFCRERHVFDDGDNQRGRDQMLAIRGMITKISSPAILTKYVSVMNSVSDMFLTSVPQNTISQLIKDMINDPTAWNVQTYNVTGKTLQNIRSRLYPNDPELQHMDVTDPDMSTVNIAKTLMSKIRNGEVINVNEYVEGTKQVPTK